MVASWEHLEQIPTIKLTFVPATFVLATFDYIRNISAVTDETLKVASWEYLEHNSDSQGDICLSNICPG